MDGEGPGRTVPEVIERQLKRLRLPVPVGDSKQSRTSGKMVSMRNFQIAAAALAFSSMEPVMAQERIRISSDWGNVTAELSDNTAARSLASMLPLTIEMSDHL